MCCSTVWIPSTLVGSKVYPKGDILRWHKVGWFGSPQYLQISQIKSVKIQASAVPAVRLVLILKQCLCVVQACVVNSLSGFLYGSRFVRKFKIPFLSFFFFFFFFWDLGTEPRALHLLGKRSTTELNPQPQ